MEVTLEPIRIEQKPVLVQMLELYNYDFSAFSGDDISEYGYFGYPYIDAYWNEQGRYPFFIRVDGKLAGLVLVRSCSEYVPLDEPHNVAEFFVMKKYRRKGVGRSAAMAVFDRVPGGWEISVWDSNMDAKRFWHSVVEEYTAGCYERFNDETHGVEGFTFHTKRPSA